MASKFDDMVDISTGKRFSWSDYQKTDAYRHSIEINEAVDKIIAHPDAPEELAVAYDAAMEVLKEEKEETSSFTKDSFDSFAKDYACYAVEVLECDVAHRPTEAEAIASTPALRAAVEAVQKLRRAS